MNLTEADLDADWAIWDNKRNVQLFRRDVNDQISLLPETVEAVDSAFEVNENYEMQDAGDDAGQVFNNTSTYALRKSQIGGKIFPGSKIIDWDGKTWWVRYAKYKSWDSRVMVILQQNEVF